MVSKVARTSPAGWPAARGNSPAKVASSRAGRTSPDSKVVSNADLKLKGPAHRRAFALCRKAYLNSLRGFRLLIDRAFRDLSEGRIGLLFFIESLFEKTDSIA